MAWSFQRVIFFLSNTKYMTCKGPNPKKIFLDLLVPCAKLTDDLSFGWRWWPNLVKLGKAEVVSQQQSIILAQSWVNIRFLSYFIVREVQWLYRNLSLWHIFTGYTNTPDKARKALHRLHRTGARSLSHHFSLLSLRGGRKKNKKKRMIFFPFDMLLKHSGVSTHCAG